MHEYSVANALFERVAREARARKATAVRALSVRIGELAGVEPGLLATAWSLCREGTMCAEASLAIEHVPARWDCSRCGRAIAPGEVLRCGECGAAGRLSAGDEIVLDRIEMEVP
jgi:hydrogenase nickel incorporation protein HypA/HybF